LLCLNSLVSYRYHMSLETCTNGMTFLDKFGNWILEKVDWLMTKAKNQRIPLSVNAWSCVGESLDFELGCHWWSQERGAHSWWVWFFNSWIPLKSLENKSEVWLWRVGRFVEQALRHPAWGVAHYTSQSWWWSRMVGWSSWGCAECCGSWSRFKCHFGAQCMLHCSMEVLASFNANETWRAC